MLKTGFSERFSGNCWLKVGAVDYINFLPFYAAILKGGVKAPIAWTVAVPSELNRLLFTGELDAAPVSSAEYLIHQDSYDLLPSFCIGAEDKVMSVCLFTSCELHSDMTIGLTHQSASSALLVKVLCHHYWKVSPHFVTLDSLDALKKCEAFLLIGNDCLLNKTVPGYKTIDLAEAWHRYTQLPFTFAVFAARKGLSKQQHDTLRQILHQCLTWGDQHPDVIGQLALERCPSLTPELLREYYNALRYQLNAGQMEGLRLFARLIKNLPKDRQETAFHAHQHV